MFLSFVYIYSLQETNLEALLDKDSSRVEKSTGQIGEERVGPVDSIDLVEFNKVSVQQI